MQLRKFFLATMLVSVASSVGVTSALAVTSDYPDYTVEDGVDLYVDSCTTGGDFTVTIDGDVYEPGDIASGFSLESSVSFTPSDGATVGWLTGGVVQDGYGHGLARDIDNGAFLSTYLSAPTTWTDLEGIVVEGGDYNFFPGVFYSPCDTPAGKYAHVQVFPGFTFEQIGLAMDLSGTIELVDETAFIASGLPSGAGDGLAFAPLSNFANGGYAFWTMYLEAEILSNSSAQLYYGSPGDVDFRQAGWGWAGFRYDPVRYDSAAYDDFASGFYLLEPGSDSLSESTLDSVYQAPVPSSAPTETIENRGIFLHIAGQPAREVSGTPVYFGSVGTKADSTYILSVQSVTNPALTRTVLATGSTSSRGHADRRIELGNLAAGTYKVVMTGVHDGGYPLVLTNYISVDRDGYFISLSPESLQPTLN